MDIVEYLHGVQHQRPTSLPHTAEISSMSPTGNESDVIGTAVKDKLKGPLKNCYFLNLCYQLGMVSLGGKFLKKLKIKI